MGTRAGRSWGTGLVGALAVHAAVVLAVVLTLKIDSPPKELAPFVIQLVQPWRPPPPSAKPPPKAAARSGAPAPGRPVAPAPTALSAPPAAPAAASPSGDDLARVRGILRGSVGCADAKFYHLSETEKAKCARLLQAHLDPNLHLEAPIDPAKRAWFDASLRARQAGKYMPLGPPADYSIMMKVGGVGGKGGGHDISVGPLHVGLPPGAFNDDDAPPPP